MRSNTSVQYGLLAVYYLAKNQSKKLVITQSIADEYNIPPEYLYKILENLVKAGILKSKRGPGGGFLLAKSPKKITMLEIIEAIDGPMVGRIKMIDYKREKYARNANHILKKATDQYQSVFQKTKLSDLL
ncbi:RrF2 family transcriptional regulator [Planctomycetota bacterium]